MSMWSFHDTFECTGITPPLIRIPWICLPICCWCVSENQRWV